MNHRRNWILLGIILAFIFISLYFSNILRKDCGTDEACFNDLLSRCSGASYTYYSGGNVYLYESSPSFTENCKVKVTLLQSVEGSDIALRERLEGKSMVCTLPRSRLQNENFKEIPDFADHCTGPLKEGMYEIIVQKMYSLVIANLGEISEEARKTVAGF